MASLHPTPGHSSAGSSSSSGGAGEGTAGGCRALSDLSELASRPGWWQLPAVKEGRVFVADHALLCRPGPRCVCSCMWALVQVALLLSSAALAVRLMGSGKSPFLLGRENLADSSAAVGSRM